MNAIIQGLQNAPTGNDDYIAYLHGVLGGVQEITNPSEVFPYAFRFFEDHAGADLGRGDLSSTSWNDSTRSTLMNSVRPLPGSLQHTRLGC